MYEDAARINAAVRDACRDVTSGQSKIINATISDRARAR